MDHDMFCKIVFIMLEYDIVYLSLVVEYYYRRTLKALVLETQIDRREDKDAQLPLSDPKSLLH